MLSSSSHSSLGVTVSQEDWQVQIFKEALASGHTLMDWTLDMDWTGITKYSNDSRKEAISSSSPSTTYNSEVGRK